jgi:hypothetical protein
MSWPRVTLMRGGMAFFSGWGRTSLQQLPRMALYSTDYRLSTMYFRPYSVLVHRTAGYIQLYDSANKNSQPMYSPQT